ncbi:MAG: ArsR/SmtB family transcription factor, partial [Bradymonadaceae bacterium]
QLARIGKSLSSGPRLELLNVLSQGPRNVEALATEVKQSVANTSHHLQVLRHARLVEADKDGVRVIYRLAGEDVGKFFCALRRLGEDRLLEIEEITRHFFGARQDMERVDAQTLVARVREGAVIALDVRPVEEYQNAHIPGAISIPLADLERRLDELPVNREIVAYCRGPYCVLAMEAIAVLRERGFSAILLGEGVNEWRARGLPVETQPLSGEAPTP